MGRSLTFFVTFITILLLVDTSLGALDASSWTNTEVTRDVLLQNQFEVHQVRLQVTNSGSKDASVYYLALSPSDREHLSLLAVTDSNGVKLTVGGPEPSPS